MNLFFSARFEGSLRVFEPGRESCGPALAIQAQRELRRSRDECSLAPFAEAKFFKRNFPVENHHPME
jgi:hypothetical protein